MCIGSSSGILYVDFSKSVDPFIDNQNPWQHHSVCDVHVRESYLCLSNLKSCFASFRTNNLIIGIILACGRLTFSGCWHLQCNPGTSTNPAPIPLTQTTHNHPPYPTTPATTYGCSH